MSREPGLPDADGRTRRRPTVGELIRADLIPFVLYISLQFLGLVLHLIGAARRADWPGTLATVFSLVAWLVLLVGLARLVVKLRALVATRSRQGRYIGYT
jgi:hypothetical protein